MAANEKVLGDLHEKVALVLAEALEGQTIPGDPDDVDEATGEPRVHRIPPSAALIQVATKFLKDNDITCSPSEDNALGELKRKMEERAAKRAATKSDLAAAKKDMSFMEGLPN